MLEYYWQDETSQDPYLIAQSASTGLCRRRQGCMTTHSIHRRLITKSPNAPSAATTALMSLCLDICGLHARIFDTILIHCCFQRRSDGRGVKWQFSSRKNWSKIGGPPRSDKALEPASNMWLCDANSGAAAFVFSSASSRQLTSTVTDVCLKISENSKHCQKNNGQEV